MNRSELMSRIRSKETKPEIAVCKALWAVGAKGYRKNDRSIFGVPDISWKNRKLAVFVDSCFWHCCPEHFRAPKTNIAFWRDKFARNRKRDKKVNQVLRKSGWTVLRFWTHTSSKVIVEKIQMALFEKETRCR